VQNTGRVRGGQTVGHTHQQLNYLKPGAALRSRPVLERATVNELGYQVLSSIEISGVMDRQDVWMVEDEAI
jgi:hypothetical protein